MKINPEFKKIATRAAKESGEILMKNFGLQCDSEIKRDNSLVSKVDYESEKKIIEIIKDAFPSHDIMGEEKGGELTDGYCWIVDALDGTTNYLGRVPVFCNSIALYYDREPIMGVVFNPVLKDLYFSGKGQGFFINGQKTGKIKAKNPSESVLVLGKGKAKENFLKMADILKKMVGSYRTFRVFGASVLDLCSVAAGRTGGFVIPGADLWDVAAGVLMVEEAGGYITDFSGNDWTAASHDLVAFNNKDSGKALLKIIK